MQYVGQIKFKLKDRFREHLSKIKKKNDFPLLAFHTYWKLVNYTENDFSTLYTTLPHDLLKTQLIDLIEHTFRREKAFLFGLQCRTSFFHYRRI